MRAGFSEEYLLKVYFEFDSCTICGSPDTKDVLQSELNTDQVEKNWI